MDMDTKDKLEKLDEKVEQMKIEQREMRMEIIILLESLKANGPIASSSPQVESAQLPSERLETRIVTTDRRQFILFYLFYFSLFFFCCFVFICISAFWFALPVTW